MNTPFFEDDDYFGFLEAKFEASLEEAIDFSILFNDDLEEKGDWAEEGF